jgi:hypothetical protein
MAMSASHEPPPLCVLDKHGVDRLLERLRAVHGEAGRPDIAPELRTAKRIKDRAIRRGGELLAALQTKAGRPKENRGAASPISKAKAAKDAGLSPDQAKDMLRVAASP